MLDAPRGTAVVCYVVRSCPWFTLVDRGLPWPGAGRPPLGCFRCVGTEEPRAVVLARVDDVEGSRLRAGLDDAFALVPGRFFRREVRVRARACLAGMLSGLERKTSWSLAEHAGEVTPDGMQRLFTTARWDAGGVRDDLRGYVAAALGSPDGVLIGDDTGFEKGGTASAGVQRQYTGTAGKIMNCQLGVFLAYASPKGRALAGRELYRPRSWTGDQKRLAAAGVPEGTGFRTKPRSQATATAWPARPTRSAVCSPRSARRRLTSSTPAAGHDGATAIRNAPVDVTTSDKRTKVTKCGWSTNTWRNATISYGSDSV